MTLEAVLTKLMWIFAADKGRRTGEETARTMH